MKDVKNEVFSEKRKRTILSFLFSSVGIIFLMMLAEVVLLFIAFGKLYNYLLPLFGVLTIINIITIIYTIISLFSIYNIIINYNNIIEDIRTTLGIDKLSFEIDVNVISNNLFKGFLSYGK